MRAEMFGLRGLCLGEREELGYFVPLSPPRKIPFLTQGQRPVRRLGGEQPVRSRSSPPPSLQVSNSAGYPCICPAERGLFEFTLVSISVSTRRKSGFCPSVSASKNSVPRARGCDGPIPLGSPRILGVLEGTTDLSSPGPYLLRIQPEGLELLAPF